MCGPMFTAVLDMDKLYFLNDKMMSSYGVDSLQDVVQLCESLLLPHSRRLGEKVSPLYRAMIIALTRSSHALRTRAAASMKKILSAPNNVDRAVAFLADFTAFIQTVKVSSGSASREEGEASAPAALDEVSAHSLVHCLYTLTAGTKRDQKNWERVATAGFKAAHYPAVTIIQPDCWENLVRRFGLVPKVTAKRCYSALKEDLIKNFQPGTWQEACLGGLYRLLPDETMKDVLDVACATFNNEEMSKVTRDDYFVFLTPEGELYDRSLLEAFKEEKSQNIKRESRVYSYKEQMEEIQLRRELEEKRKREGKYKEPELNPKQKEALRLQLEKESAIRKKVAALHFQIQQACSMLNSALDAIPPVLATHFTRLVPCLTRAMSSPVAAPTLSPFWIGLSRAVFDRDETILAAMVGHVTLRLVKPQCDLNVAWEAEPLDEAARRVLRLISQSSSAPFSAPKFVYCFPLIRGTLRLIGSKEDELAAQGIQILERHAGLRSVTPEGVPKPENNPRLLPMKEMIELLVQLIGRWCGREQQFAYTALLEVAAAASGGRGCTVATDDEVGCLTSGLESHVDSVRDACLHSLSVMLPVLMTDRNKTFNAKMMHSMWVAKFDVVPEIRTKGEQLWTNANLQLTRNMCEHLLQDVTHMCGPVRSAGAEALSAALQLYPTELDPITKKLLKVYNDKMAMTPPVVDEFGRELQPAIDVWEPRAGIGLALGKTCNFVIERNF